MTEEEKKYTKIGLGVLAGGLLLYFLLKKEPDNGGSGDPTNNGGVYEPIPFNPKTVAENLFIYMDQFGTDEDEIIAELTNVNQSQFAQVVVAFGKRNYNSWTGGDDYGGTLQPLKYWLREELSDYYYNTLKLKYPNQL